MFGKWKTTRRSPARNREAELKTEEVLRQIAPLPPLKAPPYFYAKLKARMENEEATGWRSYARRQPRLALAMASITLLLLLNALLLWESSTRNHEARMEQEAASFAEDYDYSISQY